jgi:hypothetical protein
VIRFSCPHCGRAFVLPDALARLPLLCKGCGQRVAVPDPQPDEEPEPEPQPKAKPKPTEESVPLPPPPEGQVDLFEEGEPKLPEVLPSKPKPPPAAPAAEPDRRPPRKLLATVVDVAVGLVLLAVGGFGAEMLLGKSTRQVIDGASGPKFPSTDLVVWLGLPAALVLIYGLLAGRGRGVGGRLGSKH